ncbi:MAG: InlB B-repeat-containing protein, partial [Anaeroplasmataceae bacterium]|nr:InlB B-repeat-containing protein [Anaeroplasmataceae bacterium]
PIKVASINQTLIIDDINLSIAESFKLNDLFKANPVTADNTVLAFEVVEGNDVVSIQDGVLTGLSAGTATIKALATDDSGVEKEVTVNVSSGAYANLNNFVLEDVWAAGGETVSGFTSVAYSNKTFAQISVQEDSVFGNAICIAGNGGKDSSGAHLDKYISVSDLSANKDYKFSAWIKLNPEAAGKTSGTTLDLKFYAYHYENGRYSYGELGSAYGNQIRTSKADLVNGWIYVETPVLNLDTNAIGYGYHGIKLEIGLWNGEQDINAYITHLALVEVEGVTTVDWNLVDDNNHALDTTNNLTIQANSTYQINAVSIPSSGTISPTFASSDETIATVDENGLVTILNQIGTVTITVTVGNASKEITFDVTKSAESITLDSETINIILHSFDPRRGVWNITVTPADSTSELVATVENEDVCTATIVDNKLYISNPALGSTTITISAADNPSASFTVVVNVKEYTVTYDVQGHGVAQESVENVLALPAELPTLEAEGYVFGGWYLDAECTTIAEAGKEITEDTTLYAKWTKTFTITYDVLGHGTAPESVTNAVALPATLPTVSVEGYVFEAWYLDAECTTIAEAGKEITADTTLYAKWVVKEADKFSVVYNAQGHGTAPANVVNVTALPATLPTITAEGYVFGGWYLDADCAQKATEGAAITADTTLYAKWTQVFTVTYDVQGHGTAQSPVVNVTALPEKLPTLEAEGFEFGGWYLDADCAQKATEGAAITANTTLYAKWTQKNVEEVSYTISYNVQGHGTAPADAKGTKLPDSLPTLSATGYTFDGWYLDADCTQKAVAGAEITADTTLYAKWTEKQAVTPTPTPATPEKTGLPGGAIAGIVIAVVVVLGAAGGAAFFFIKKKQAPKAVENKEETGNTEDKE